MKPCYIYGITFYKSNKAREAVVYSEFITAKCLTTPPSCDKFTVNHGFLGLIALICYLFERKFSGTFGGIWLQLQVMWLKTGRVCNYVIALTSSKYQDNKVNQSLSLHYILLRNDICWFANNILLPPLHRASIINATLNAFMKVSYSTALLVLYVIIAILNVSFYMMVFTFYC